jgi:hypothetical protein
VSVFPELVTGRRDDFPIGAWKVHAGSPVRGGASCNFTDRILTVPLGSAPVHRVIRAHELTHLRVSPHTRVESRLVWDVHDRALECAEEYRVNTLLNRMRFEVGQLRDGSERMSAERVAQSGEWCEALCFLLAVLGTGGERDYFRGIRTGRPEWVGPMRAIAKRARTLVEKLSTAELGDTQPNGEGLPAGYDRVTLPLARMLSAAIEATPPQSSEGLRRFRHSLEPGSRRPPTMKFAPLVLSSATERAVGERRRHRSTKRATSTGVALRYPSRLLTDPYQRGFVTRRSCRGGVVLIDQSGSMDISVDELHVLLRIAPDALILGYSHRPGDRGQTPNAWILADHHGVVPDIPAGNIGNGVDGPALEWALSLRQPGEPLVWVTDGQVTDSHDHPCDTLSLACALTVRRHRIRLVRSVTDVGRGLQGFSAPALEFGRVGRKLLEATH